MEDKTIMAHSNDTVFHSYDESSIFTDAEIAFRNFLNTVIMDMVNKRMSMHITQADLARQVGISKVSMCRIETRAKTPSLETLFKIALCLNMKIVALSD